ncbi:polycomb group RING finger protein 6 isoform X1 [Cebidichthys violaceus]|uniref:polycomb group RING finger protein 6 isoform X1 n=1 Tax=Cebidichthys violaceus TaxID=271503 RepID=UPI0035CC46BD
MSPPLCLPLYGRRSHEGSTNILDSDSEEETKLPLKQFYPYIRCALCCGFLIDATTITECLHTFCKNCIVKHFFHSNRCPTCSIVVHQTQPLYNIRPDRQLQDIVYKMVPFLEESEREQMCNFYKERGLAVPKPGNSSLLNVEERRLNVRRTPVILCREQRNVRRFTVILVVVSSPGPVVIKRQKKENVPQSMFTIPPELDVSLLLDFVGAEEGINNYKPLERRYVRVSGEATVRHVELFIRRKMELSATCQVDVVCGDHLLDHYQSLKDIQNSVGEEALQDGLLVLHFGLVLPSQS